MKKFSLILLFVCCAVWATGQVIKADHFIGNLYSMTPTAIGACTPGDVRVSNADGKIKVCNSSSAFVDPGPFTSSYDSGEVGYSNGTVVVVSHGLGGTPPDWKIILRNKVAELGYAVGDEVQEAGYAVSGNVGSTVFANPTQIGIRVGSCLVISNRSGLADSCATAGNWRLVFRGWR